MIKFDIKNRYTGELQFTAEIDCSEEEASKSLKLGLAVKWALKNEADLSGANLSEADLSWANLREADLSWANLSEADLSGADLRWANLREADLSWANLREADLSGADLRWANLRWANLRWANFSGANFSGANFSGANLSEANLREADLSWANLSEADLSGANFSGANLSGANLSEADLRWANLSRADLSEADLSEANFSNVPEIENIHQKVCTAVEGGGALDMANWHNICGTKHCRAGWVVTLAGKEGKELEDKIGTSAAACLIYLKSDPNIKSFPDFHCSDEEAMEDIIACAEREKETNLQSKGEAQ